MFFPFVSCSGLNQHDPLHVGGWGSAARIIITNQVIATCHALSDCSREAFAYLSCIPRLSFVLRTCRTNPAVLPKMDRARKPPSQTRRAGCQQVRWPNPLHHRRLRWRLSLSKRSKCRCLPARVLRLHVRLVRCLLVLTLRIFKTLIVSVVDVHGRSANSTTCEFTDDAIPVPVG